MIEYLRILLDARFEKMDERGASAVEYGLLVAVIALVMAVGAALFGTALSEFFGGLGSKLSPGSSGS